MGSKRQQYLTASLLFGLMLLVNLGADHESFHFFQRHALAWLWFPLFALISGALFFTSFLAIGRSPKLMGWLGYAWKVHWLLALLCLAVMVFFPMLFSILLADFFLSACEPLLACTWLPMAIVPCVA